MENWIQACGRDDVAQEDVIRFQHAGKSFAIYRSPDDKFYATDGLCTHEKVELCEGLVMDHIIECPKHNGRFDIRRVRPRARRASSISRLTKPKLKAVRFSSTLPDNGHHNSSELQAIEFGLIGLAVLAKYMPRQN